MNIADVITKKVLTDVLAESGFNTKWIESVQFDYKNKYGDLLFVVKYANDAPEWMRDYSQVYLAIGSGGKLTVGVLSAREEPTLEIIQ